MSPVTDQGDREAIAGWLASPRRSGCPRGGAPRDRHAPRGSPRGRPACCAAGCPTSTPRMPLQPSSRPPCARLAAQRYGIDRRLLLTRDGLEQGTRPDVADRRARMFAAAGARRVLDLTAGPRLRRRRPSSPRASLVTAVERDPVVARYLAHNCPDATVVVADATDRRRAGRAAGRPQPRRTSCSSTLRDATRPARATPRRPAVGPSATPSDGPRRGRTSQSIDHPRVAAKVAPGLHPAAAAGRREWVSVDRTVVECSLASWPLSGASRRAVVMTPTPPTVVDADPALTCPRAETIGPWVHEPDPAVARAGAVPALAAQQGLALLDADSSWLTGQTAVQQPGPAQLPRAGGARRQPPAAAPAARRPRGVAPDRQVARRRGRATGRAPVAGRHRGTGARPRDDSHGTDGRSAC